MAVKRNIQILLYCHKLVVGVVGKVQIQMEQEVLIAKKPPKPSGPRSEFDRQVKRWMDLDLHKELGMAPDDFVQEHMRPLWMEVRNLSGNKSDMIPFIIVIPEDMVSLERQLEKIDVGGKKGGTNLPIDSIMNAPHFNTPKEAHIIREVDPGLSLKRIPPEDAMMTLPGKLRKPLTAVQVVATLIQRPEVMNSTEMEIVAAASMVDRPESIPVFGNDGRIIRISCHWASQTQEHRGVASCSSRLN